VHKAIEGMVGTLTASGAYLLGFALFWISVWGATRLGFAARREEIEDTAGLVLEAPGRCYVAGVGFLILGWFLLAIGKGLGPLVLLVVLWWIRHVFRGLIAWFLVRGRQVRTHVVEDPGTDADALREGVRSTALASALPFLGWAYLFMAALQAAGAESLRSLGRRAATSEGAS
jgi:hypothetical protein